MQQGRRDNLRGDDGASFCLWRMVLELVQSVVVNHVDVLPESNAKTKMTLNPQMNPPLIDNLLVVTHSLPHLVLCVPLLLGLVHQVIEDAQLLLADVPTAHLRGYLLNVTVLEILKL